MEGESRYAVTAAEMEKRKNLELYELSPDEIVDRLKSISPEERKKYLDKAFDDPRNIAMVSYYEKWLHKKIQLEVDEIAARKIEEKCGDSELPLGLEKRFSSLELKILIDGLFFIQPTFGCSKACPFCAWDAPGGVRSSIKPRQMKNLLGQLPKSAKEEITPNNVLSLHFASEPSDYKFVDETGELYTFKDLYRTAKEQTGSISFLTRDDDDDWLDFVKTIGGGRSLDNATAGRLERQVKKRGFADVRIHEAGGDERIHKPGIGLSTKKTRELVGTKGIYKRKPGTLLTPRGIYNMFPGEIQPDSPNGAPQGVLAVPIGELRHGERAYETIRPGIHLRDVMGNFLIQKMFDVDFLSKPEENLITFKLLHACLVFAKQPNNEGRLITYDPKTYQIETVQTVTMSPEEYWKKYIVLRNAGRGLLFKQTGTMENAEKIADFKKIFPGHERQINNLLAFSEIIETEEGKLFLTTLYQRYLQTDNKGFKWQILLDAVIITMYLKKYMDENPDLDLYEKTREERERIIKDAFLEFIDSDFFQKMNQDRHQSRLWMDKNAMFKPIKKKEIL